MKSRHSAQSVGGWLLLLIVLMTGCSRSTTASGTVSFHGRPVICGSVIFVGADKVAHSGVIASDGTYTVEGLHPEPLATDVCISGRRWETNVPPRMKHTEERD